MNLQVKAIRPFIGAKDFDISRQFYRHIGFEEVSLSHKLCLFERGEIGFYLQDAYIQQWIDNTMVFITVEDVHEIYDELLGLNLEVSYKDVRLMPIRTEPWGKECFLYDPSGILWHFGQFLKDGGESHLSTVQ